MIVGAGIVGSYLAGLTGEIVWEKQTEIREKACSGLVSKRIKQFHVPWKESALNEVRGAKLICNGRELFVEKMQPCKMRAVV